MGKTVVFDFDGVIHSYTSGWKGETVISDPPVVGIENVLKELDRKGYEIVIVSTRCSSYNGMKAVSEYLNRHGLNKYIKGLSADKPPAICYVDDRALKFDPAELDSLVEQIENFKPWNDTGNKPKPASYGVWRTIRKG